VLEHETDLALAHVARRSVLAIEQHLARIGRFQAGDDAQQRGLAAAGGAQQPSVRPREIQRYVVERGEAAETLLDVMDFDAHDDSLSLFAGAVLLVQPPFDDG
jgi:hypothetical protein